MSLPNYNAAQDDVKKIRRYFIGTTVLRLGQVLGLDHDASASATDPKARLGYAVEALTANNVTKIAGIVAPESAGLTGPCYVTLLQPQSGDVVKVEVEGTADVSSNDFLTPDNTAGALIKLDMTVAASGDAETLNIGEAGGFLFRALQAQASNAKVAVLAQKI